MCLAAIYWSRCDAIYYGCTAADAAAAGFDDSFLYEEMKKPLEQRTIPIVKLLGDEAMASFEAWRSTPVRSNTDMAMKKTAQE